MSDLDELISALNETNAASAHLAKSVGDRPSDEVLQINARAIEKRNKDLKRRLEQSLSRSQNDLVQYKISRDWNVFYSAKAVASSLGSFQELFTAIFDAVKAGPKQRFRPSQDNIAASTFNFAGATTGSVLISLSVPNERLIAIESDVEQSFSLLEDLARSRTAEQLNALVATIGVASISKAYQWADASVSHGLDTTISWGRFPNAMREINLSDDDAKIIRDVIEHTTQASDSTVEIRGILHGFDGATSYFHLEDLETKQDLKGDLDQGISPTWTTGQIYIATLKRIVTLIYATGQEKEDWTLINLRPPPESS